MDFSLKEANDFITRFVPYSIVIVKSRCLKLKVNDYNFVLSCALEACFSAFLDLKKRGAGDRLEKGYVRRCSKNIPYHRAISNGHIPDKKRVYFPKKWVALEEFQLMSDLKNTSSLFDIRQLLDTKVFTETEKFMIGFFLQGMDFNEISKKTGYGTRHIAKTFQNLRGRIGEKNEVSICAKTKWGKVGPYQKKS